MEAFPDIADHGMIGDLQSVALISTEGAVDWFCAPRFDSPSIFAALLDREKGGTFRIRPPGDGMRLKQMYFPQSAVLITRFMSADGVGEVIDFMPVGATDEATPNRRIVRGVRVVRGHLTFRLECRAALRLRTPRALGEGLSRTACASTRGDMSATLHGVSETRHGGWRGRRLHLRHSPRANCAGSSSRRTPRRSPTKIEQSDENPLFQGTVGFWRDWLGGVTYTGRWREDVERSAMALKLLTYAPSGALVAAPTAALPEQLGGLRNWDYRFTWIRDSSFSVYALLGLGYTDEAVAFMRVARRSRARAGGRRIRSAEDHVPDRRIAGSREQTLDALRRIRAGRSPVRIGNGAADQLQLDIYGEAMDAISIADGSPPIGHRRLDRARATCWTGSATTGTSRTRASGRRAAGRKDFTYGRVMCWVALDRGDPDGPRARPARRRWRGGSSARDAIYEQVFTRCWNAERQAFIQHPETDRAGRVTLLMPRGRVRLAARPACGSRRSTPSGRNW